MDQNIGKLLDNRYELLDVIGVGGMAVVYKAYCHRLHRFVAVKILKSDLASDAEFRRRFHDEAQAVAMLSHANIVSVYDVSHSDDLDYIVMELIDGITLKQYMKSKGGGPLNWREALHFITQIMRALDHAHGRGIIHRDIKPQNIMVLRDGSVKVADFGIARVMSAAQNTLTQEALGSVHYISPEQARGRRIDARADIYSAGVVLYEMLTGRLPFEGDSPVSVAIQHISSTPIAPRELNSEIPETLETITLKAMSANIERRYRSAADMIDDLEEFRKNPGSALRGAPRPAPAPVPAPKARPRAAQPDEPTQVVDTGSIRRAEESGRRREPDGYDEEYPDEYREEARKRAGRPAKKRTMVPVIVVVALFLVGVGVFLYVTFFSDLFTPHPGAEVPKLVGQRLEDVLKDPAVTDAFTITPKGETVSSEEYPEGYIVEQDPAEGKLVKGEKPPITVVISSGPEIRYVDMPDVVEKPYEEAVAALTGMGLKVAEPTYEYSDTINKDTVISSNPVKGAKVEQASEVTLVVSKGKEIKKVMVPHLVGMTQAQAEEGIKKLKLTLGKVDPINSDSPAGEIIWQSITGQTEVDEGTTIDLQVSLGPKEEPDTVTKTLKILLPTDRERVTVRVTLDNEVKYEEEVETSAGSVYPNITGVDGQMVDIYYDGVHYSTEPF